MGNIVQLLRLSYPRQLGGDELRSERERERERLKEREGEIGVEVFCGNVQAPQIPSSSCQRTDSLVIKGTII